MPKIKKKTKSSKVLKFSFTETLTVVCTFVAPSLYCVNWVLEIFIFFSFNSKFAMICGGSHESEVSCFC